MKTVNKSIMVGFNALHWQDDPVDPAVETRASVGDASSEVLITIFRIESTLARTAIINEGPTCLVMSIAVASLEGEVEYTIHSKK